MHARGRSLLALALVALAGTVVVLARVERGEQPLGSAPGDRVGVAGSSSLAPPPSAVAPGGRAAPAGERSAAQAERSAPADEASASPGSFHGLVLDGQSGAPLAGALAQVRHDPLVFDEGELAATVLVRCEARSGPDGVFRLDHDDGEWIGRGILRREGYGARTFLVEPGHSSRAEARVIELLPCASLEVVVRDGEGRPRSTLGVELRESVEPIHRAVRVLSGASTRWRAKTDETGRALFACLPAGVRLGLTLSTGRVLPQPTVAPASRQRAHATIELVPDRDERLRWVALAPGEHETIELVSDWALLRGIALDEDGAPVTDTTLVLARPGTQTGPRFPARLDRAYTDRNGRFEFRGIAWGPWELRTSDDEMPEARLALVVDRAELEVELRVPRGLPIAGRVEPDGTSEAGLPEQVEVRARPISGRGSVLETSVAGDGTFRFPAVAPGEYEVSAWETFQGASDVVRTRPGEQDVRLRLLAPIPVRVRTGCDSGGELEFQDRTRGGAFSVNHAQNEIELAVRPGRYALTFTSDDDRIGFLPQLELSPGSEAHVLALELQPAAVVTLAHPSITGDGLVRLHSHGAWFDERELLPNEARTFLVPPGPLAVELLDHGQVVAREDVELAPRERLRLELGPR